jgi:DNA-binding IclR family transcriptional regulator
MTGNLSTEVEDFITKHIDSMGEMDVLLLLAQDSSRWWSAESVYEQIKSSRPSLIRRLETLTRKGLLVSKDEAEISYRFSPTTPELTIAIQALKEAYAERRLKVLECLSRKPIRP